MSIYVAPSSYRPKFEFTSGSLVPFRYRTAQLSYARVRLSFGTLGKTSCSKIDKARDSFCSSVKRGKFPKSPASHRSPGFLLRGGSRELFEFVTVACLPRYTALVKSLERPSFHVPGSRGPKPRKSKNVIKVRIS